MKMFRRLQSRAFACLLVGGLVAGCDTGDSPALESRSAPPPPPPPPPENRQIHLDHAQPKLHTVKLWIGSEVLVAEVAVTSTEVATGMMFRKEMGENEGMLFVFPRPQRIAFYMRNTLIPLSAAYISSEGNILEIHNLQPQDETPVPANSDEVQFVLEVKQGWFERHKVSVGTAVRTDFGSFQESFFRRKG